MLINVCSNRKVDIQVKWPMDENVSVLIEIKNVDLVEPLDEDEDVTEDKENKRSFGSGEEEEDDDEILAKLHPNQLNQRNYLGIHLDPLLSFFKRDVLIKQNPSRRLFRLVLVKINETKQQQIFNEKKKRKFRKRNDDVRLFLLLNQARPSSSSVIALSSLKEFSFSSSLTNDKSTSLSMNFDGQFNSKFKVIFH